MKNKTILLIDDDTLLIDVLSSILEQNKYRVLKASSAEFAMDLLTKNSIDLIICDYKLPVADGLEFANSLLTNQETASIPFILLTGMDNSQIRHRAGNVETISKPFDVVELLSIVQAKSHSM